MHESDHSVLSAARESSSSSSSPSGSAPSSPHILPHVRLSPSGLLFPYSVDPTGKVKAGTIALNSFQRRAADLALGEVTRCKRYVPQCVENVFLASIKCTISIRRMQTRGSSSASLCIPADQLKDSFCLAFKGQFLSNGQRLTMSFGASQVQVVVDEACPLAIGGACDGGRGVVGVSSPPDDAHHFGGVVSSATMLRASSTTPGVRITGGGACGRGATHIPFEVFETGWSFERIGIGGMDREISDIFRRAFAPRMYPPGIVRDELGIRPVKGVLLHGPPGTGKTLIAKKIGRLFNGDGPEPVVVNGPEILDKYVGEAEKRVRDLFSAAERDWELHKENSDLHIIILDELDAIAGRRGSTPGGGKLGDTIVNQLLTKLEGYHSLHNILVIGMTNRKEMIDEALLRSGRLELHIEIGLPDEEGRLQILRIHTKKMRKSGRLLPEVSLREYAHRCRNFTGAELKKLVHNAGQWAAARMVQDVKVAPDPDTLVVCKADWEAALCRIEPAFGVNVSLCDGGDGPSSVDVLAFSNEYVRVEEECRLLLSHMQLQWAREQPVPSTTMEGAEAGGKEANVELGVATHLEAHGPSKGSSESRILSILLTGPPACGKTTFANHLASTCGYPYVKRIDPVDLLGMHEREKADEIRRCFQDAYRSQLSLILIEDIERLLDYAPIGPRYSNVVLQTLLVLIGRPPPCETHRLFVIGTSNNDPLMNHLDLSSVFGTRLHIPLVHNVGPVLATIPAFSSQTIKELQEDPRWPSKGVPIKQLLRVARQSLLSGTSSDPIGRFYMCLARAMHAKSTRAV